MGNRRKLRRNGKRDNSLRMKKNPGILQRGIAKIVGSPEMESDEMEQITVDLAPDAMASDTTIVKVVPAKHKGVVVGDAYIHEDAQVTLKFHDDAPQWALDEIRGTADSLGYSLETGTHDGTS